MKAFLPFLLLFGAACGLSYVKEIDRLERDQAPARSGKKFLVTIFCALGLCFLFTLWSVDAGLILLTLTLYLISVLAGISLGQTIAQLLYRKRNPEEE